MTDPVEENRDSLEPQAILDQAAAYARHLERIGVQWLPVPRADRVEVLRTWFDTPSGETRPVGTEATAVRKPSTPETASKAKPATAENSRVSSAASPIAKTYAIAPLPVAERESRLTTDQQRVAACEKCRLLSKCRTHTVYGEGNASARFVFFGEAPGRDEDLSGRPFVGKAGQLLTKMILACELTREEVYIMNTVKCRPPNNRNPEPAEIENCREYFESQLETIQPEYIVCLGLVAAQTLLHTKLSVGRLRGKLHQYFDSKVLVTYHPSYLLRAPQAKRAAWSDLQLMLRDAGLMS